MALSTLKELNNVLDKLQEIIKLLDFKLVHTAYPKERLEIVFNGLKLLTNVISTREQVGRLALRARLNVHATKMQSLLHSNVITKSKNQQVIDDTKAELQSIYDTLKLRAIVLEQGLQDKNNDAVMVAVADATQRYESYRLELINKMQTMPTNLCLLHAPIAIILDPYIATHKIYTAKIDFEVLSSVLVFKKEIVAAVPAKEIDENHHAAAVLAAKNRYRQRFISPLLETRSTRRDNLTIRGVPGWCFIWLMPEINYNIIGPFKILEFGFPW